MQPERQHRRRIIAGLVEKARNDAAHMVRDRGDCRWIPDPAQQCRFDKGRQPEEIRIEPDPEKLYSWWSYRGDWKSANRGRRLDHIWATPGLAERCDRIEFISTPRGWDRPSDHIPVMARFSI